MEWGGVGHIFEKEGGRRGQWKTWKLALITIWVNQDAWILSYYLSTVNSIGGGNKTYHVSNPKYQALQPRAEKPPLLPPSVGEPSIHPGYSPPGFR